MRAGAEPGIAADDHLGRCAPSVFAAEFQVVGRLGHARSTLFVVDDVRPAMNFTIEAELEDDGRWLAEVPQLPGVLAYGSTRDEAMSRAQVLALRVIAERLEHGEAAPQSIHMSVTA